jgi:hypothetical protein
LIFFSSLIRRFIENHGVGHVFLLGPVAGEIMGVKDEREEKQKIGPSLQ